MAGAPQGEPLVIVVDHDQVAQLLGQTARRLLELLDQVRLGQLAPLLEREREVVELVRGRRLVVGVERLAGRPVVGGPGVRRVGLGRDRLLGPDPGDVEQVIGGRRFRFEPGGLP